MVSCSRDLHIFPISTIFRVFILSPHRILTFPCGLLGRGLDLCDVCHPLSIYSFSSWKIACCSLRHHITMHPISAIFIYKGIHTLFLLLKCWHTTFVLNRDSPTPIFFHSIVSSHVHDHLFNLSSPLMTPVILFSMLHSWWLVWSLKPSYYPFISFIIITSSLYLTFFMPGYQTLVYPFTFLSCSDYLLQQSNNISTPPHSDIKNTFCSHFLSWSLNMALPVKHDPLWWLCFPQASILWHSSSIPLTMQLDVVLSASASTF